LVTEARNFMSDMLYLACRGLAQKDLAGE